MKQIKLQNLTINLPKSWNEITLEQFINFMKWINNKPQNFEDELTALIYNVDLIKIFSFDKLGDNFLNEINLVDLKMIVDELQEFIISQPQYEKRDHFIYNDVTYSFVEPNNMSVGEYVSYRQLAEGKKAGLDVLPDLLAILCRPADKVFNEELKKDVYVVKKFEANDIAYRADLMRKMPAFLVVAAADFFFYGNERPTKNLNDLTKEENQKEVL
jgi:hypothetical protein